MSDRRLLALLLGFIVGNYLWQFVARPHDYERALERSLFQGAAIFAVWVFSKWQ